LRVQNRFFLELGVLETKIEAKKLLEFLLYFSLVPATVRVFFLAKVTGNIASEITSIASLTGRRNEETHLNKLALQIQCLYHRFKKADILMFRGNN
jgi:hypothetical protein